MGASPSFEWDAGNQSKCQSHGVSIAEIETVFLSDPYVGRDERHSHQEDRYVAVGRNAAGRPVLVIYTLRVQDGLERVRPLSARYMHVKEVRWYEEAAAKDHH